MRKHVLLAVSLLVSAAPCAAAPSTETWEYWTVKDVNDLSKPIPDPTNKCEKAAALTVAGHLGWELVQVVFDTSREQGTSKGVVALGPVTAQGQRGSFELRFESKAPLPYAIFKRRAPHVAQTIKVCP